MKCEFSARPSKNSVLQELLNTTGDNHPQVEVEAYEDNHMGEVSFDVDMNGTSVERGMENKGSMTVESSTGRLGKEQMVREAKEFAEKDKDVKAAC